MEGVQIKQMMKKIEEQDAEIQDLNEKIHELCQVLTQLVTEISHKTGHNSNQSS